ncbi:MAG: hypothetical protein PHH06_03605 [Candidatus Gracilibacteria bacterium]|nr:hypothetical protein [Candidatus Gracilibacteria bacterium]
MTVRSSRNGLQKTLKDYLVPIVALFLIIVLFYSVFSGGDENNTTSGNKSLLENSMGATIEFGSENSEVYIEYSGGNKKLIEDNTILYKGEKVIVKLGSINIEFPMLANVALDKMGTLEYRIDGSLYLDSSNMWLEAKTDMEVSLKYGSAKIGEGSVVNLNQNEVESSIYNIAGVVEVFNLAGEKTVLGNGQKVSILVANASNDDLDLSALKEDLGDYFKASDWFIKNGGDLYLKSNNSGETSSGNLNLAGLQGSISSLLAFDNLSDESSMTSSSIDITGKYNSAKIGKITLNGKQAILDVEDKTFEFTGVSLKNSVNDLVFKVYDTNENIIQKLVYTIYYGSTTSNNNSSSSNFGTPTTFEIDGSKFVFTEPSTTGTFTTYDNRITIKGSVPAGIVSKVSVNGYVLSSFNGTSWRYHAWSEYNNLSDGTNIYQVNYYDNSNNLIYTNSYTIIKKSNTPVSSVKETYSSEAKLSN